ncbi:hypothetical protein Q9295_10130 [Xinfangfangia sp. CPCC 101601]|uniref:Uncharacterized protein n=1 Tax=Pseudogemmobacter lacusdianii TaxID=3069608 RepID=A0ABU0W0V4_9RHOB|nr:hypothetical protein [Xinfangfangia sp. CPCC 101601]MDQ2066735.1 hypothetical protein [Xinfangfangia sp. CPCC 101601]
MTTYALVTADRSKILSVGERPTWIYEDAPVSDDVLRAGGFMTDSAGQVVLDDMGIPRLAEGRDGWVPVIVQPPPEIDPHFERCSLQDQSDWVIYEDKVVRGYVVETRSYIAVQAELINLADEAAEQCRSVFLTSTGGGQALEYSETRLEADSWVKDPNPDLDNYPMLRAELNALRAADPEATIEAVLDDVNFQTDLWRAVGAKIKEVRRTCKVLLTNSTTLEELRHIRDWAQAAFRDIANSGTFTPYHPITSISEGM